MTAKNILRMCIDIMQCDITNSEQTYALVFRRAVFYQICIDNSLSYVSIGKACGKDHATVHHGIKVFKKDIEPENSKYHHPYYGIYQKCSSAISAAKEMEIQYSDRIMSLERQIKEMDERLKKLEGN